MIKRQITPKLLQLAQKFPVVALTGPRQSGKTTLVRHAFPEKKYLSLEDPDLRGFALEDPRGFLQTLPEGAILDEIQRTPQLFSYLQTRVDQQKQNGLFILTGSQNFLLQENISQTLAGRVAILKLLPFSLAELRQAGYPLDRVEEFLFKGFYPRIYDQAINPADWYPNYIQTYVERDVRLVKNISDIDTFQRFIRMCAARIGQVVNLSSLGNDCGLSHNTVKAWLAVLEASFIIYYLRPYYKNYNKRLVKSAKIYFYDPGLAGSLLGITNAEQLATHYLKGGLFEALVIGELIKARYNQGLEPNCYFWLDQLGHEIDCLQEQNGSLTAIEIKAGQTISGDYFKGLAYWQELAGPEAGKPLVIYGGPENQTRSQAKIISWSSLSDVLELK